MSKDRHAILRILDAASLGALAALPLFLVFLVACCDPRDPLRIYALPVVWVLSLVSISFHLWLMRDLLLKIERALVLGGAGFIAVIVTGMLLRDPDLAAGVADRMEAVSPVLDHFFRVGAAGAAMMAVGFFWFSFCVVGIVFVRQLEKEVPPGCFPR